MNCVLNFIACLLFFLTTCIYCQKQFTNLREILVTYFRYILMLSHKFDLMKGHRSRTFLFCF